MPNILITNLCNQNCSYCFAVDELKKKKSQEMKMTDFKKVLDFLEGSDDKTVRLMGGEPTLHSKFKEIVEYVFTQGFSLQIYTNGIFPNSLAEYLANYKDKIWHSFNINPPEFYPKKTWNQINENLKILFPFRNVLIGSVISQKDFNIDYLIYLAKKYSLRGIVLRTANPIIGQNNQYLSLKDYPVLAKNLVKSVKKSDKHRIRIGFGCGLSKNIFSEKEQQLIKDYQVVTKGWGCDGNSGRFDVGVDLSVFRCFPLSNWQTKKLFDFNSVQEIEGYFNKLMEKQRGNFIHQGPCFSYSLSKK